MGLDMYLTGRKFNASMNGSPKDDEGYEIEALHIKLGYWRKHANLHGYIVQTFAEGEDNCQDIELSLENLEQILEAVKAPTCMAKTEGFFFGESSNTQDQIDEDVAIISRAIGFLTAPIVTQERDIWRTVIYRASW